MSGFELVAACLAGVVMGGALDRCNCEAVSRHAAAARLCAPAGAPAAVYSGSGPSTLTTGAPGPMRTRATSAGSSGGVPSRWINPRGTWA